MDGLAKCLIESELGSKSESMIQLKKKIAKGISLYLDAQIFLNEEGLVKNLKDILKDFPDHDDGRKYQIKEASYRNIINPDTNRFISEQEIFYESLNKIVQDILKEKHKDNHKLVLNCKVGEVKLSKKFPCNIFYKNQEALHNNIFNKLHLIEVTYSLSM